MSEINNDDADILTGQEDVDLDTTDDNDNSELEARLAKAEELANNYKVRAEKAEKLVKTAKPEPVTKQESPKAGELSSKDLIALMEAKVSSDDIDEVTEFAKFKGISVAEALKTSYVKSTLVERAEQRNTASAANVGGAKRGSGKTPDDVLLSRAAKGELPDNDADMDRVIKLRLGIKE